MKRNVAIALTFALWLGMPRDLGRATVGPPGPRPGPPNIVLILTDDQTADELDNMPNLSAQLIGKGVTFSGAFVSNPLCCPSRTSILTGMYSHGTDVYRNDPPHGGYETFVGHDESTIASWLHDGGYATALVGKYLNGYDTTDIPPGWDRWEALLVGDEDKGYYDYDMNVDGARVHYGSEPQDYSTDVLAGFSTDFIRSVPQNQALLLYFAPHAPHLPAIPPPRYAERLKNLPDYRPPNFNEPDMSREPAWVQALPVLQDADVGSVDDFRNRQVRTLMAVDDAVSGIIETLNDTGRLGDTLIVFTSDNGLENGSHRWRAKQVPWEESIHVPMIVRYDPLTAGKARNDAHIALNIDLAPTFADLAGLSAPGAEGISLLPLLRGEAPTWRTDFLLEHLVAVNNPRYVPTYCGVRTERYKYVRYEEQMDDGIRVSEELYDLTVDPYELVNLADDPREAVLKAALYHRMVQLCSPPPPGYVP